ncbi:MAG TPA: hypothetical protein VD963_01310 [Phycisphaerales bacterium]|nr:hypothetical protein [Phycisphaerales bacterium]
MNGHMNLRLGPCLDEGGDAAPVTRRERLVSRIVDGEAGAGEWQEFRALAQADPSAWRELAEAQREFSLMSAQVGTELALGAAAELPLPGEPASVRVLVRSWGGWAVAAAAVLLAWPGLGLPARVGGGASGGSSPVAGVAAADAGLVRIASPEDAVRAYLEHGKRFGTVLGEVPERVVMDTRPCQTGDCYEVLYLRQFIERAEVCDIKKFGYDEAGLPVAVPVADPGPPGRPM